MNIVRFATIICLIGTISAGRTILRTWINPVSALASPFLLSLALQSAVLSFLPFGWRAALVIAGGPVALLAGATCGITLRPAYRKSADLSFEPKTADHPMLAREPLLHVLAILCLVIALVFTLILYRAISVRQQSVVDGVFYREDFFKGEGGTLPYRILQLGMYLAALFMALYSMCYGMLRLAPMAFIGLAFGQSFLLSTRTSAYLILAIFGCAYVLSHGAKLRDARLGRLLVVLLAAGILTFAISAFVSDRRAGSSGGARPAETLQYFLAGSPSALSLALDGKATANVDSGFGISFAGIRELVGRGGRVTGLYLESTVVLNTGSAGSSATNIFTWYYPLLLDFGWLGMFTFIFGLGMVIAPLSSAAVTGQISSGRFVVLITLYLLPIWGLITPLTYYNFWTIFLLTAPLYGGLFVASVAPSAGRGGPERMELMPSMGKGRASMAKAERR